MKGFFSSSVVQKERPAGMVPKCGACGFYRSCNTPKMEPHGEGAKRVLIVGDSPGDMEDEEGRPFVGKAGQLLRQTLAQLGLRLDRDAIATNALICKPPNSDTLEAKQISWCRPNLLNTIAEVQPRVVITLGRPALVSILTDYWNDVGPLERWLGWQMPLEPFWLCPTYHPSYLLRMRNELMDRQFSDQLEAAFNITCPPPKQEPWEELIEVLYDDNLIQQALEEMDRKGGWAAVDYEGNCLKPEYPKARAYSFAVSNGERTISYPWTKTTAEMTRVFLHSKRTRKIASNLKMEERWTRFLFGRGVRRWGWDTMLAAHCLDNRPGICSLKFQSLVKMGIPSYNDHIEPYLKSDGHYNRIQEIDTHQLLLYGGMDALFEHRLAMIQRKELGYG